MKKTIEEYLQEARKILKEEIEIRVKESEKSKFYRLDWKEKWKWNIVNALDTIDEAIKHRESRKSWWDRWGKRILKILEAALIVGSKLL